MYPNSVKPNLKVTSNVGGNASIITLCLGSFIKIKKEHNHPHEFKSVQNSNAFRLEFRDLSFNRLHLSMNYHRFLNLSSNDLSWHSTSVLLCMECMVCESGLEKEGKRKEASAIRID